jgi:hypothetical protein
MTPRIKKIKSNTFLNELEHKLSCRTISPEVLEANKIIKDKIEGLSN